MHLQNYLGTPRPHTWSLAVEEHFYLLLPVVVTLTLVRSDAAAAGRRWFVPGALAVIMLAVLYRCVVLTQSPFENVCSASSTRRTQASSAC